MADFSRSGRVQCSQEWCSYGRGNNPAWGFGTRPGKENGEKNGKKGEIMRVNVSASLGEAVLNLAVNDSEFSKGMDRAQLRAFAKSFGLTPGGRRGIRAEPPRKPDPGEEYFTLTAAERKKR